jgi:transcription termination/antitermination protein NusA
MKLTQETISQINLFEKVTRALVKDCYFEDDFLIFLIEEGNIQKAIGREGANIRKLEGMFRKKIKILGFSTDPVKFINNLLYPVRAESITIKDKTAEIKAKDNVTKGKIMGRSRTNLHRLKTLLKRYNGIEEIKVI